MKTQSFRPLLTTALVAAALIAPPLFSQEKPGKPVPKLLTVAVLDFAVTTEEFKDKGGEAAALLIGLLTANEKLVLVERADLAKVLAESEMSLSGTVSADSAAKVGQLTGAKILVTGRIFTAGEQNYVVTKVISAETGRVFGQTAKFTGGEGYGAAVEALAGQISGTIADKTGELIPKIETAEDRLARLRKSVAGKALPKVFVEITEEHLTRRVPDPAAQTEIQKTLQDVGFPLVANSEAADVVITGEAFSEAAGRRGGLVSCRARVEIKISDKAQKDKLQVDRQTSVAVDLAENVAGKSALQSAGSQLSDRLVASLAK
jgi:hypothetical protein